MRDLKLLQQMQQRLLKAQEEIAASTVEGSAGGGAVVVVMSGTYEVREVRLDPAAVDPEDVETLAEMIRAAVNDAVRKVQELTRKKMGEITGGLKIPGLF